MIRWRFVLTRLIVVVAILMIIRLGLGPMASYITIAGLEASTGAKAEIGSTQVGLFPPRVRYQNVRIADPRDDKEFRDAFKADAVDLVIDGDAFLRRRWVIRRGLISGIEIGTRRDVSGHYEPIDEPVSVSDSPSFIEGLVTTMTEDLSRRADTIVDDLQTVRTADEIRSKWEQQYDDLVKRAEALEARVRTIRDSARGIDNPLRDWPEIERTLAEAKQAREDLLVVRKAIDELPSKMQSDLVRLEQARQADLAKVDQYVPGDLKDSKNFGVDLITNEIRRSLTRLRDFLESGRTLANYTVVAPDSQRVRGETFDFLGDHRQPEMMIRECEVGGILSADGKDLFSERHSVQHDTRA